MIRAAIFDINSILKHPDCIHAHKDRHGIKPPETLREHLNTTHKYFVRVLSTKKLEQILDDLVDNMEINGVRIKPEYATLIKKLFVNAIYLHDIGKATPPFQHYAMGNPFFVNFPNNPVYNETDHSMLSAMIYLSLYSHEVVAISRADKAVRHYIMLLLYSFAYMISKHHGFLQDDLCLTDQESFRGRAMHHIDLWNKYPLYLSEFQNINLDGINHLIFDSPANVRREKIQYDEMRHYILNKMLFSLLIGCDVYATSEYQDGNDVTEFGTFESISGLVDAFEEDSVIKGIREFERTQTVFEGKPINELRSKMFLEAENALLQCVKDKNIFYLEAPTGSGKTLASLNLVINILKSMEDIRKVYYVFPANTLVDQTHRTVSRIFDKSDVRSVVINSVTPIVTKDNQRGAVDFAGSYMDRMFLHYPLVMTSHVNLYNTLFGNTKDANYPLFHLANSVVVLDEIQSHNNQIWKEIIMFLAKYSELLNIKIIIMSATLPKLDKLIPDDGSFDKNKIATLIANRDLYFKDDLFKNRVTPNYELLDKGEISQAMLVHKIDEVYKTGKHQKFLVGMISKKESHDLYEKLKAKYAGNPDMEIYEMSGDDNPLLRHEIIQRTKSIEKEKHKTMILVATQVIEAGVDIDMDVGFKHIAIFDGEEQFMGRINRSCEKDGCVVYFFYMSMAMAHKIYEKDVRLGKNLIQKKYRELLTNKEFHSFYEIIMAEIDEQKSQNNLGSIALFMEDVKDLRFASVQQKMKVIDKQNTRVFLPSIISMKDDAGNTTLLDGVAIWKQYKTIIAAPMGYARKKIELSKIQAKMNFFMFNITGELLLYGEEEIGGIFYIADGAKYISSEGKFLREAFEKAYKGRG